MLRGRWEYWELLERAISYAKVYRPNQILVEKMGVGIALVDELTRAGFSVVGVKPEQDKRTRMSIQAAKFRNGQVLFPKQEHWLADLLAEILVFPNSRHDDQIDSISQAMAH
jgi:predicted phage terminase large subunit-like protein